MYSCALYGAMLQAQMETAIFQNNDIFGSEIGFRCDYAFVDIEQDKTAYSVVRTTLVEKIGITWLSPDPDIPNLTTQENPLPLSLRVSDLFKKEDLLFLHNNKVVSNKSGEVTLSSTKVNAKIQLEVGLNEIQLCIGETCSRKLKINYTPDKPKMYVLAIGPDYSESHSIANLKYPEKDAIQVVEKLKSQEGFLYSDVIVNMITGVEADATNINRQLSFLLDGEISSNDVLLIYVSSHGGMYEAFGENRFFIFGSTFDHASIPTTSVAFSYITGLLKDLKCKKIAFIDACNSGGAKGGDSEIVNEAIEALFLGQDGLAVFSSSSQSQLSYELENYKNGAFTKVLLDAVDGQADVDRDRKITLREIDNYISKQVPLLVRKEMRKTQEPRMVRCDLDLDLPIFVLGVTDDQDGDGISDMDDDCPEEYGPKENDGCPMEVDSDADGIADVDDDCPEEYGPKENNGCPIEVDSDADGIADVDDDCPEEYGPKENNGCPIEVDSDADGIADVDDDCPEEYGPKENDGCPIELDSDADGIADVDDDCPEEYGPKESNGCPMIVEDEITSIISSTMVFVEGGGFKMGCTGEQGEDCEKNELPVQNVTVNNFYLNKFEVTQAQWKHLMGRNPSANSKCKTCPVEKINRDDALAFISKLNKETRRNYRLPTEAEWEYAARGGAYSKGYKYSGSDDLNEVAWYNLNSKENTHPVGSKVPNELGIYDMSGNVLEWCSDKYGVYVKSPLTNPKGAYTGGKYLSRGGCWYYDSSLCRVTARIKNPPKKKFFFYGLRLASDDMY